MSAYVPLFPHILQNSFATILSIFARPSMANEYKNRRQMEEVEIFNENIVSPFIMAIRENGSAASINRVKNDFVDENVDEFSVPRLQ
jgi:hypothetical protein